MRVRRGRRLDQERAISTLLSRLIIWAQEPQQEKNSLSPKCLESGYGFRQAKAIGRPQSQLRRYGQPEVAGLNIAVRYDKIA